MYVTDKSRSTEEHQFLMPLMAQDLIYYGPVPWGKSIRY